MLQIAPSEKAGQGVKQRLKAVMDVESVWWEVMEPVRGFAARWPEAWPTFGVVESRRGVVGRDWGRRSKRALHLVWVFICWTRAEGLAVPCSMKRERKSLLWRNGVGRPEPGRSRVQAIAIWRKPAAGGAPPVSCPPEPL